MFLRISLLLAALVVVLVNSDPVDIFIQQIKASGKTYLKYKLTAKCEFRDAVPDTPPEGVRFQIQLDTPSTKFSSKHVSVLSSNGSHYTVTNKALITKSKFSVTFSVVYEYEAEAEQCFPEGICTSLEPTTTSSTTSTTTTPAPTPDPTIGTEEYVDNGGMEDGFTDNWSCVGGCTLETSSDSYTGALSAKISNRDQQWNGLSQFVDITGGSKYIASGFVKLLNTVDGAMYHAMQLIVACTDTEGNQKYVRFGSNDMIQPGIWTEIGGIVEVPSGYTTFRLYIQCSGVTAEYLVDDISLREFLDDPDWLMKANNRIDELRKADISITVTDPNTMSLPANLTLEIKQVSHKFAFGSVVGAEEIVSTDPIYVKYQDWFYEHFEWGLTGNALKWKPMEGTQGVIDYNTPTLAINAMRSRGIKVRGHCVFWSIDKHVPDWVEPLNETETEAAIETRINGVISNTSGLLEHWDVNNENLHGDFFERNTGDANVTMDMFRQINVIDPDVKLFLNDYGIVENTYNQKAWAMKSQAELFREAGVPIYGVGIQSHISADFHVTVVKARLDKVAEAGLPMWITELSLIEANVTKKAKALEDLMTMYFSHPSIEGIILWGFWDGRIWKENATLVEGDDLTPNEAGEVYQRLFKTTWRTNEVHDVIDSQPIRVRGFKGDYEVYVKQDGVQVAMDSFTLDDENVVHQINLM